MGSEDNWLLCLRLRDLEADLDEADEARQAAVWARMERALERADAEEEEEVALPVLLRDRAALRALFDAWDAGRTGLPAWDRAVLKRALKAYRKRLKVMRLDDASDGSRNPLSKGSASSILGIRPPEQYPPEIWALLVAQGRLRDAGGGLLEPAAP